MCFAKSMEIGICILRRVYFFVLSHIIRALYFESYESLTGSTLQVFKKFFKYFLFLKCPLTSKVSNFLDHCITSSRMKGELCVHIANSNQ